MENDLSSKTYIVTGATSGIGFSTAGELAHGGAVVIGVGRSRESCREMEATLRRQTGSSRVHYLQADLSVQKDVEGLPDGVTKILHTYGRNALDGCVNNAGTFKYWLELTPDGVETQWAVNHLAPFILTHHLLPLLKSAPSARIVTVSSGSHYGGRINWVDPQLLRNYSGLQAYSNTKLANILFTQELNLRLERFPNVRAFAADPGLVKTDIGMKGTPALAGWIWKVRRRGGSSPEIPARGIVFLLTEPSLQNSCEYYWKDGRPRRSSRTSMSRETAEKLWNYSEKLSGIIGRNENGNV